MNNNEIWTDIVLDEYRNKYQISNYGRVKLKSNGIIKKQHINGNGYFVVSLSNGSGKKKVLVHRLVAIHFIKNPNNYPIINHKNGIKTDNYVENLEWCTNKMNVEHAWKNGLCGRLKTRWTDELCIEISKTCNTMTEFKMKYPGGYTYAHKTDLWKTFTWFKLTNEILNKPVKPKKKKLKKEPIKKREIKRTEITIELCLERASKCKTWEEFSRNHKKYSNFCKTEGIVDLIKEEIKKNNPNYKPLSYIKIDIEIQKQICLEKAQLCKTKVEYRTKYKHEYAVASANKWLKEYTWLTGCKGVKDENKKRQTIEIAKQCTTKREFREEHPVEYALAAKYKILKDFTWLKGCKKEK